MNKIYRIVWSDVRQSFIVAAETATARGKPASTVKLAATGLVGALMSQLALAAPAPDALPTGGAVVAGQAAISQSGSAMTISQDSNQAILNWQSFNIGSNASVNFQQPSSSSVALNRVIGSDPSAIYGSLTANGQVFLVNPNGVLFGQGARVDVGGLVASTMDIRNEDFLNGDYRFTRDGSTSAVNNLGELYGQYIALLAPEVRNEGVIIAQQGTAVLAAGEAVTLNITGNQLVGVAVEQASIDTLVQNKHLVQAEDGTVIMSAQSASELLGQVVNSGAVEAQGIVNEGGVVRLLASDSIDHSGTINVDGGTSGNGGEAILLASLSNPDSTTTVSGSISARGGSEAGDGGFIETSARHLKINDTADIDTRAPNGSGGEWLLDPDDFIVAAAGGDIDGGTLGGLLDTNANVTIQTTATTSSCTDDFGSCGTGATAGNGDIIINDVVSWTGFGSLTLEAYRDIQINQSLEFDPFSGAMLEITYGTGGTGKAVVAAGVDMTLAGFAVDNTYVSLPVTDLALIDNATRDYYIGTKNIPIYVGLGAGGGVYGTTVLPTDYFADALGTTPINIAAPNGTATWSTDPSTFIVSGSPYSLTYTGGFSSDSYSSFAAGPAANWTVTPRAIELTADDQSKIYGDTLNLGSTAFTVTNGSLGFSDTVTSATLASATGKDSDTSAAANTYAGEITISGATGTGGFNTTNYTITYAAGDLTVNKATLTYTADTASMTEGDTVPALSGNVSGFKNAETLATATTGTASWTSPATSASSSGNYAINGSGLAATNYDFVQAAGNATALTIAAAAGGAPSPGGTTPAPTGGTTLPSDSGELLDIITKSLLEQSEYGGADNKTQADFLLTVKGKGIETREKKDAFEFIRLAVKEQSGDNVSDEEIIAWLGGVKAPTMQATLTGSITHRKPPAKLDKAGLRDMINRFAESHDQWRAETNAVFAKVQNNVMLTLNYARHPAVKNGFGADRPSIAGSDFAPSLSGVSPEQRKSLPEGDQALFNSQQSLTDEELNYYFKEAKRFKDVPLTTVVAYLNTTSSDGGKKDYWLEDGKIVSGPTRKSQYHVSAKTNLKPGTEVTVAVTDVNGETKTTKAKSGEDGSVKVDGAMGELKQPLKVTISSEQPKYKSDPITIGDESGTTQKQAKKSEPEVSNQGTPSGTDGMKFIDKSLMYRKAAEGYKAMGDAQKKWAKNWVQNKSKQGKSEAQINKEVLKAVTSTNNSAYDGLKRVLKEAVESKGGDGETFAAELVKLLLSDGKQSSIVPAGQTQSRSPKTTQLPKQSQGSKPEVTGQQASSNTQSQPAPAPGKAAVTPMTSATPAGTDNKGMELFLIPSAAQVPPVQAVVLPTQRVTLKRRTLGDGADPDGGAQQPAGQGTPADVGTAVAPASKKGAPQVTPVAPSSRTSAVAPASKKGVSQIGSAVAPANKKDAPQVPQVTAVPPVSRGGDNNRPPVTSAVAPEETGAPSVQGVPTVTPSIAPEEGVPVGGTGNSIDTSIGGGLGGFSSPSAKIEELTSQTTQADFFMTPPTEIYIEVGEGSMSQNNDLGGGASEGGSGSGQTVVDLEDTDGDGTPDATDLDPFDPEITGEKEKSSNTEGENNKDVGKQNGFDSDGDGVPDAEDAFPFDPTLGGEDSGEENSGEENLNTPPEGTFIDDQT